MIAADTETVPFRPGCMAPRIVAVSAAVRGEPGRVRGPDGVAWLHLMVRQSVVVAPGLVLHNGAYDLACLAANEPRSILDIFRALEEDRITDTLIRERLIDIATGDDKRPPGHYSLAATANRRLGVTLEKDDSPRLDYARLLDVPIEQWPAEHVDYARRDAETALGVWESQEEHAAWLEDQYRQTHTAFCLQLMSCWGVRTDRARIDRLEAETRAKLVEVEARLIEAGLVEAPRQLRTGRWTKAKRETKKAAELVLAAYGEKTPRTPKGGVKTDDETCRGAGVEVLADYAEYSSLAHTLTDDPKGKSGIALLRRGQETPIHVSNRLLANGRNATSPNINNLPREGGMRECFVPRAGYVYVAADYSAFELHALAEVCKVRVGYSRMGDALNAGADLHTFVAAQMLGIHIEDAERRKGEPEIKAARQSSKVYNFGLPGGLGVKRLVDFAWQNYRVRLTQNEAKVKRAWWFGLFSEVKEYLQQIGSYTDVENAAPLQQLYSNRFRGGCGYTDAANTMFSGLAADCCRDAIRRVVRACFDPASSLCGSRLVNSIHDELIVESPEESASAAADELVQHMLDAGRVWMPSAPPRVGDPVLMRYWAKDAKSVRVDGRWSVYGSP